MARVWIGLGSNLGDPPAALDEAAARIEALPGVYDCQLSPIYRTPPWGVADQPDFANACLRARTATTPLTLLRELLAIEQDMGRERRRRWGERVIDLDLLVYEGRRITTPSLLLPHPWLEQRAFVLRPMMDLDRGLRLAGGDTVEQVLAMLDENERAGVVPWLTAHRT